MSTIAKPVPAVRNSTFVGVASLVFVVSKATAFLAPMLLARALPVEDYGRIELALAWGTPSAVLVGLGLHGAVPYFLLKRDRPDTRRVFFLHILLSALILGITGFLARAAGSPLVVVFAIFIAAIFCAQNIFAALLKTYSFPASASFTEVALYCILFVFASGLLAMHHAVTIKEIYLLLLAMVGGVAALAAVLYLKENSVFGLQPAYRDTIVYSSPIIIAALLSTVLMSGGRILIGALLGVTDVAIFSLLFRMVAAAVLVHQLTTTLVYPKLYQATPRSLDRWLGVIQAAVLAAAIAVCVVGWPIGLWLFPPLRANAALAHPVAIVIALQMFYWCASAQCELIFYREHLQSRYAMWLIVIFVLLVGGSYALKLAGLASLLWLTQWQMTVMFLSNVGGMCMLWKRAAIRLPIPLLLSSTTFVTYWIGQICLTAVRAH